MATNQTAPHIVLTQDQWVKILADHRQGYWPTPRSRERRHEKRTQIPAMAVVQFEPADGRGGPTIYHNCQVLDVSANGLAVRTYRKIPPGTRLELELTLGGRGLVLTGTVAQCMGFPGSVRVGIALEFPTAEETSASSGK